MTLVGPCRMAPPSHCTQGPTTRPGLLPRGNVHGREKPNLSLRNDLNIIARVLIGIGVLDQNIITSCRLHLFVF